MSIGDSQAITAMPTPETVLGGGYHCPGCGVPFLTERGTKGPERAVYTGINVDFDGSLILCESCVGVLASAIGWINPEQGKARSSDVRRAQRREALIQAAVQAKDNAHEAAHDLCAALDVLDAEWG